MTYRFAAVAAVGALLVASALTAPAAQGAKPRTDLRPTVSTARAASATQVLTCLRDVKTAPSNYVADCADVTAAWRSVVWSHWGSSSASGAGDLIVNDCTPQCRNGDFHTYRAQVRLTHVKHTHRFGDLFSTATFTYAVHHKHRSTTVGLLGGLHSSPRRVQLSPQGGDFLAHRHSEMSCEIDYHRSGVSNIVYCQRETHAFSVQMSLRGKLHTCNGKNGGCLGNPAQGSPTVPVGDVAGAGPFRCLVSTVGLVCSISSSGRGFVLTNATVHSLRGY
jgi:hypothetical protein